MDLNLWQAGGETKDGLVVDDVGIGGTEIVSPTTPDRGERWG